MDTSLEPPDDTAYPKDAKPIQGNSYMVQHRSVVVLVARLSGTPVVSHLEEIS